MWQRLSALPGGTWLFSRLVGFMVHYTGTIGPKGLMEKDLVLDVALRLGRMLEEKLGAEVIYTRSDDTFVAPGRGYFVAERVPVYIGPQLGVQFGH